MYKTTYTFLGIYIIYNIDKKKTPDFCMYMICGSAREVFFFCKSLITKKKFEGIFSLFPNFFLFFGFFHRYHYKQTFNIHANDVSML